MPGVSPTPGRGVNAQVLSCARYVALTWQLTQNKLIERAAQSQEPATGRRPGTHSLANPQTTKKRNAPLFRAAEHDAAVLIATVVAVRETVTSIEERHGRTVIATERRAINLVSSISAVGKAITNAEAPDLGITTVACEKRHAFGLRHTVGR